MILLTDPNGNNPVLYTELKPDNPEVCKAIAHYLNAKEAALIEITPENDAVYQISGKAFPFQYSFTIYDQIEKD